MVRLWKYPCWRKSALVTCQILKEVISCTLLSKKIGLLSIVCKYYLTLYSINQVQQQTVFENIVGKEEIAGNKLFLLFPQCFLLLSDNCTPFVHIFDIIFFFAAELKEQKIGI